MSAICRSIAVCGLILFPATGWAQSWEVEVHGGRAFVNNLDGGTGTLPTTSVPLATYFGRESRQVSSWYFGDGAELLNDVLSQFGASERITTLDPVLTGRFGERGNGGSFGLRVGRAITPRFGAEFNLDFTSAPVRPTAMAQAGIEASANSFVPALTDGLLGPGPFANITGSSDAETFGDAGNQVTVTGALTINARTQGRILPYATVGAGIVANRGEMPVATLDGGYSFDFLGIAPLDESDHVEVRHAVDDRVFVGVVGGGVKAMLTRRSGIRADVRVHLGQHTVRTLVSATADSVPTTDPFMRFVIESTTVPAIQLSNDSTSWPTTLSGPAIADFASFTADGLFRQVLVSVGYFWRF